MTDIPSRRASAGLNNAVGRRVRSALVLVLSVTTLPGVAGAQQSADDILAAARDRYDEQSQHVENYTLVQETGGRRQVVYYERRERDGHVAFVPVGPLEMLMESGALNEVLGLGGASGGVLPALKTALEKSASSAGLSTLQQQIEGMDNGVFADFLGPLLTPEPGEDASLGSLTSGDHLKAALLAGAKKAALHQVEKALLSAAAPQLDLLLQGLQSPGGGGEILHKLGGMLAQGALPRPGQLFGQPGAPGPAAGPSMARSGLGGLMNGAAAAAGMVMAKKAVDAAKSIDTSPAAQSLDLAPDELFDDLAGHVEVTGTEEIDGHDCWVLAAKDPESLGDQMPNDFRSPKITIWIDRSLSVTRRLRVEGEAKVEGDWKPMVMETGHDDFQDEQGLLLPHRSTMSLSGMSAAVPPDKLEEMKKQMAQMKQQLAQMPPQQRAMAEQMMKSRMPQMEAMLGGSSEPIETVVEKVTVNQGPPDELLSQAKAMMKAVNGPR